MVAGTDYRLEMIPKLIPTCLVILSCITTEAGSQVSQPFAVDYPAYFSGHDIVHLSPFTEGFEGTPLGNGDLGAMLWCNKSGIELQINKSDTWDEPNQETEMLLRSCARLTIDLGVPALDWMFLNNFEGRLSLYNAESTISAETAFFKTTFNTRVQSTKNLLLVRCSSEGRGDLKDGSAARVLLERWGSRAFPGWYHGITRPADLGLGNARVKMEGEDLILEEKFTNFNFAVVCRVIGDEATAGIQNRHVGQFILPPRSNPNFTIAVAVVTSRESSNPVSDAISLLNQYQETGEAQFSTHHREWWSGFWKRSFVHLENNYLENLYYHHLYLMGSGSRGAYPLLFNAGLWTWNHDVRQWVAPHHWNMQQSYWSVCAANQPELLKPYLETYWRLLPKAEEYAKMRGFTNAILWNEKHDYAGRMLHWQGASFVNNFTPATQIGQLFWQYYLYTGDKIFLSTRAYPFMKKAAEVYLQYLKKDPATGAYTIFPASPYECEIGNQFKNTQTDLGMIRTSFEACIRASTLLNVDPEKRSEWKAVLDQLSPFALFKLSNGDEVLALGLDKEGKTLEPNGASGYTFCANTSAVFPAGQIGLGNTNSPLFKAALGRVKNHPEHTLAISPIAIVSARLGLAEDVQRRLGMTIRQLQHFPQGLFYNLDHWSYLSRFADLVPNGFLLCQRDYIYDHQARYKNINAYGTKGEKVSTPTQPFVQSGMEPSAILAATVNESLLQSYEGNIRVFPATLPSAKAAFKLRAAGSFMVASEKQKDKPAEYIWIESEGGNPCNVISPWKEGASVEQILPNVKPVKFTVLNDILSFETAQGGIYLVTPAGGNVRPKFSSAYSSQKNAKPKVFQEATLGKPRDF